MAVEDECNYVFDGMQMFTVFRFPEQVQKVVEDEVEQTFLTPPEMRVPLVSRWQFRTFLIEFNTEPNLCRPSSGISVAILLCASPRSLLW